jgi:hypothetical protein
MKVMSTIGNLATTLLHSVLPVDLSSSSSTAGTSAATSSATQSPDTGQLSSFGQLAGELQQLQQSNPTEYAQVTQTIATNLQSAAQTAQANGHTLAADGLNRLSTDFSQASSTGQLPSLQDLGKAVVFRHENHPIAIAVAKAGGASGGSTSAESIIQNALTAAGVTTNTAASS